MGTSNQTLDHMHTLLLIGCELVDGTNIHFGIQILLN